MNPKENFQRVTQQIQNIKSTEIKLNCFGEVIVVFDFVISISWAIFSMGILSVSIMFGPTIITSLYTDNLWIISLVFFGTIPIITILKKYLGGFFGRIASIILLQGKNGLLKNFGYYIITFFDNIQELNIKITENIFKVDNIDEILDDFDRIKKIFSQILLYSKIGRLIYKKESYVLISIFLKEELLFISSIISTLNSDLSIRLAEQQKVLESAKGEVEKNIKGTTELELVSELQRSRLDKQIEQFEELQRVLVKV